ncbi:MAG: YrdB family protein [Bacteroidales bacterium]|nr:YrdB family protein [Bacteroidales bacterium]
MANHPVNLAVRFILELVALFAAAYWAYNLANSTYSIIFSILLPLMLATIWGVFNVKNDPSRSGKAVITIPGVVRLLIELLIFGLATWFLNNSGLKLFSWIFLSIITIHYLISFERIKWLLRK